MLLNRVLWKVAQSWRQPLSTYRTLYGPNHVKYSTGFSVTVHFYIIAGLQTCLGLDYSFPQHGLKTWCWLLFPQWKGGSQMFLRRDLCQRLMQECRFPGKQKKKSLCSASAPDKLTRSWPHYCHNIWGRGYRCLVSKSTKVVWHLVGFSGRV